MAHATHSMYMTHVLHKMHANTFSAHPMWQAYVGIPQMCRVGGAELKCLEGRCGILPARCSAAQHSYNHAPSDLALLGTDTGQVLQQVCRRSVPALLPV